MLAAGYIPPGLPGYIEPGRAGVSPPSTNKDKTPVTIYIPMELAKAVRIKSYFEARLLAAGFQARFIPVRWELLEKGFNEKNIPASVFDNYFVC